MIVNKIILKNKEKGHTGGIGNKASHQSFVDYHTIPPVIESAGMVSLPPLSSHLNNKEKKKVKQVKTCQKRTAYIYFDGLCEPTNPGPYMTFRVVIKNELKQNIAEFSERIPGWGTNNIAELMAMIKGIEKAKELGKHRLHVFEDSMLAINLVTGAWEAHKHHIKDLLSKLSRTSKGLKVNYNWIPRERNQEADRLSVNAYQNAAARGKRLEKAEALVATVEPVEGSKGIFLVQGKDQKYRVCLNPLSCECLDFMRHQKSRIPIKCKHILAVELKTKFTDPVPNICFEEEK
jgi:ribonuclease HI